MSVNFAALLDQKVGEVEKPKPLPIGSYISLIRGHEFGESSQKKTPLVRFFVEPVDACEDVDAEDLNEFGNITGKKLKLDFYLTEAALFQLTTFLKDHVGLEEVEGMSISQAIEEAINHQVGIRIIHELMKDGETPFAVVNGTFNPAAA